MDTSFNISLNIRTGSCIDSYATYSLGTDKEKAATVFGQLKGSVALSHQTVLTMDFTQVKDGIPFPVKMIGCTIDEVVYNTRIITRELFKNLNLEPE